MLKWYWPTSQKLLSQPSVPPQLGLQAQHDLPGMVDVWDHPTLLDYGVIVLLAQSLALVQTI